VITQLLDGLLLLAGTVAIHGLVLGRAFRRLQLDRGPVHRSFLQDTWLLSRLAVWTVLAHLAEITLWAMFYWWRGIMPEAETSFYFSAVTYATIGYGDVVPPPDWRLLASMEGLTGILMCAWSGGFFFATVSRLYARQGAGTDAGR
jgi:hypothetical protein